MDIMERLRYEAWRNPAEGETADAHYLAADALDEIERLRRWKAEATIVLNQWNEIAGDVNRLHAADYLGRSLPDIVATNLAAERALTDQLADAILSASVEEAIEKTDAALAAYQEARRER
jgi:hypothetical protein